LRKDSAAFFTTFRNVTLGRLVRLSHLRARPAADAKMERTMAVRRTGLLNESGTVVEVTY
jgi:hypothetical protein